MTDNTTRTRTVHTTVQFPDVPLTVEGLRKAFDVAEEVGVGVGWNVTVSTRSISATLASRGVVTFSQADEEAL